jgi:hypothetical protein
MMIGGCVRRVFLLVCLPLLGCTTRSVESGAGSAAVDSSVARRDSSSLEQESIPAEWSVFEDTSSTGEVVTASVQLPAAKDINGLLDNQARLLLRCVNGKVEASIDAGADDSLRSRADSSESTEQRVLIQLDSAPSCE